VHAGVGTWASIVYLAPLGTVLAFVLYYDGVRTLGAARAAAFTLLVPVFGVSSSIAVLGEPLRAGLAVGGAIVLLGLWLVQRPRPAQAPAAAAPRPACQEAHSRA
jgi:drug/metabolite transporter (DMT)-like permease